MYYNNLQLVIILIRPKLVKLSKGENLLSLSSRFHKPTFEIYLLIQTVKTLFLERRTFEQKEQIEMISINTQVK